MLVILRKNNVSANRRRLGFAYEKRCLQLKGGQKWPEIAEVSMHDTRLEVRRTTADLVCLLRIEAVDSALRSFFLRSTRRLPHVVHILPCAFVFPRLVTMVYCLSGFGVWVTHYG